MDPAFAEWVKDYVPFLHVTSRIEGEPHPNLLSEKGGQGFPYLVFMDAAGDVIARHQGERTVAGFRKSGESVREFLALQAKAEAGDAEAQAGVFKARLLMGSLDYAEAAKGFEAFGGKAKLGEEAAGALASLELKEAFQGARPNDPESLKPAMAKVAEMAAAGRVPSGQQERVMFWQMAFKQALETQDVPAAEKALAAFRGAVGGMKHPQIQQAVQQMEAALDALRGEAPGGVDKPEGGPDTTAP